MMKLKVIIPNSGMTRETLDQRERMLLRYALAEYRNFSGLHKGWTGKY